MKTKLITAITVALFAVTSAHAGFSTKMGRKTKKSDSDTYEMKNFRVGTAKPKSKLMKFLMPKKQLSFKNPFLTEGDEFVANMRDAAAKVTGLKAGSLINCYDGSDMNVFSIGYVDGKAALFELTDGDDNDGVTPYYMIQSTASGLLALDSELSADTSGYLIRQAKNGKYYMDSVSFDNDTFESFATDVKTEDAFIDPDTGIYDEKGQVCVTHL